MVESGDVAALPRRLHRPTVVVTPDEGEGSGGRDAVEHGQAGQGRARPTTTAAARNFNPLVGGPFPGFDESGPRRRSVGGEAEVRPADPAGRPARRVRFTTEQVEPELGKWTIRKWCTQATTSHQATARQHQDPLLLRIPAVRHHRHGTAARSAASVTSGAPDSS